ncbi:RDD family protein [Methylicorpusculum sp.]|uniref:RDD family protein n=1 Tax=Methylicorpusculum sp. TaxID=2713644 RepID=UPI0027317E61|nr:RDD family protein [Methylicorpusculum sp.]MDP2180621.1 RDD family protein [Methylicorpusculum sp.]MDP3530460.1 RDD family protein [Methylicorpusculum sp.]MDZ4149523.1 RDD family protein [Methylicorpusculum sp.]
MITHKSLKPSQKHPGFWRRMAAQAYDLFLLLAVLFVATAIILPLNDGEAFAPTQFFYPAYLLLISFIFYGWFWTHGGQTLGLRAWKLAVLTVDQKPLGWKQAAMRFCTALLSWLPLGLGFLWVLVDKDKNSWHDRLSKTYLFYTSPK